jgi:hypothetical protein
MDLADFHGPDVREGRIDQVLALWDEPIPGAWQRGQDDRLLDANRHYLRTHAAGEPVQSSEHAIEREIVSPAPHAVTTSCLGGRLVDAVNALPLAKDEQGGRAGNIEADMLLLVEEKEAYRQLLVEVKSTRDHAWYATVELLRQLRLFSKSSVAQRLFEHRRRDLILPAPLPVTAVVLAPRDFYEAAGRKSAVLNDTRLLLEQTRAKTGFDIRLTVWDPAVRVIAELDGN